MEKTRRLNIVKVAVSLISLQYGLGFLLGTSEAVFSFGFSGIIYSFSCALGLIFLALIAKYYWQKKYPIWILLGKVYGDNMRKGICFLSWIRVVGIVAAQMLGAASILNLLKISPTFGIIVMIVLICLISLLKIEKLSTFFFLLLILNSSVILFITFKITSVTNLQNLFFSIPQSFSNQSPFSLFGIIVPTILITLLGMDFHQFIIQSKTDKNAILGSLLAGIVLVFLAFLPVISTYSAIENNLLPDSLNRRQTIPFLLFNQRRVLGINIVNYLLVLFLLTSAIASGSALMRFLVKTFKDFDFVSQKMKSNFVILLINSVLIFILSITGKSIISLIVSFCAIYISGVVAPFIAYILQAKKRLYFSSEIVFHSLIFGTISSSAVLLLSRLNLLPEIISNNLEFSMIIYGVFSSFVVILINFFIKLMMPLKKSLLAT